jgi:Domain of unknown function (DUF6089)
MKKVFLILFILIQLKTTAQYVFRASEFGFGAGAAHYFGDLNQNQGINYPRYALSLFYKKNFNDYIAIKGGISYALVGASDKNNKNTYENTRNLRFESNIAEATIQSEFNFLRYSIGDFENRFTPYVSLGLGAMYYNPYTTLDGKKFFLKPLGTEGQNLEAYSNRKYSNFAMILPIGIGIKFWLSAGMTAGFEIVNRFSTTDYLDDVSTSYIGADKFPIQNPSDPYPFPSKELQDRSTEYGDPIGIAGKQRGISSTKDQYLFAQFTLSFRLKDYKCPDGR